MFLLSLSSNSSQVLESILLIILQIKLPLLCTASDERRSQNVWSSFVFGIKFPFLVSTAWRQREFKGIILEDTHFIWLGETAEASYWPLNKLLCRWLAV